jgi:hypothetical protein
MAHPYSIRASALTTVRALLVMGAVTKLSNGLSDQEDGGLPHPFSSKINIISRYKRTLYSSIATIIVICSRRNIRIITRYSTAVLGVCQYPCSKK